MDKAVKIQVIGRHNIKPSCSTPEHQRYVKLSLLDQMNFSLSTPIILFYSCKHSDQTAKENSNLLRSSLSKTLSLFYPVAGTISDNSSVIECNDNGIEYIEAQVGCFLSELTQKPDIHTLEKLIPIDLNPTGSFTGAKIQINFFPCGGIAIGVSLSPKIGDATALLTFILAWAKRSLDHLNLVEIPSNLTPHFVSDTIIPSLNDSIGTSLPPPPTLPPIDLDHKTVRLVFTASKVASLKAKCSSARVQRPSRVESVTALIWKCLLTIPTLISSTDVIRKCVVSHAVNYRKRFIPPLPQNYIGNLSGRYFAETNYNVHVGLQELVARLREGLEKTDREITKGIETNTTLSIILEYAEDYGNLYTSENVDFYNFRSLCGFPMYEADFGWGKPTWVIVTNSILKNYVLMIDTKDGEGMEAWVTLSQEAANLLEKSHELLAYADLNPSVKDIDHYGGVLQSRI